MRLPFLMAGLLLCSGHPALAAEQPSSSLMAQLPPQDAAGKMEFFNRELERCEQLYDNLMFEEADRVADLTIARISSDSSKPSKQPPETRWSVRAPPTTTTSA